MKIKDYTGADCNLFRLPPIDMSSVEKVIELALVEAWQKGTSVNEVVSNVLNNQGVVDGLEAQVIESFEFQKKVILKQAEDDKDEALAAYEEEKREKIKKLEGSIGVGLDKTRHNLEERQQDLDNETSAYSVAQRDLDEMRERLKKKLSEVGGAKGLKTLLTINEAVRGDKPIADYEDNTDHPLDGEENINYEKDKAVEVTSYSYRGGEAAPVSIPTYKKTREQHKTIDAALELTVSKKYVDPLRGKGLTTVVEKIGTRKSKSETARFFDKVWEVLNYKLW